MNTVRHFTAAVRDKDDAPGVSGSEPDSRLRYGGSWFLAATALPLTGGLSRPRPIARLVVEALRRPRRLAALVLLVLRTRREYVVLSGSCAGRALELYLNERRLRVLPQNRLCRGVLVVPEEHREYLRGRRRQALRTNLRRAAAAGIRCEVVADPAAAVDDACEVLRRQWSWLDEEDFQAHMTDVCSYFARPETTVAIARNEDGRPLAVMAAVIDDTVCLIGLAYATSHEARWALHDHLVRVLIARGVRYLLAQGGGSFGALGLTANLQHYQHLLGYELRHVIPATRPSAARRRRLVLSLAAAAATMSLSLSRAAMTALCTIGVPRSAGKTIARLKADTPTDGSSISVGGGAKSVFRRRARARGEGQHRTDSRRRAS